MKSIFEEMGGIYSDINGYLIPNLTISDSAPLGKWGRMRRHYLKEHRPALYSSMLVTGYLDQHLAAIDETCEEQLERITQQMTNTVNSLSRCVWTGEAANAYRNKFAALQDDINRMVKMIDEHVSDLNAMAKQYESAEQTSISLSASLSDNVII